ncbi:putative monooxygenase [Mycena venus]|uniref:Putative monooxygenase n=1 Tax=Mycena venus TaxID=2733690 RepID=A0A8H6WUU0_9AGAR|nr:putative monooxygenase [Mycena venus]
MARLLHLVIPQDNKTAGSTSPPNLWQRVTDPSNLPLAGLLEMGKRIWQDTENIHLVSELTLHITGDLVYLEAFGQPLIFLNSSKVAKDLLEQRSAIYSDRPHLEMAQLSGFDKAFVLYPPNDDWRQQRKIVTQDLALREIPRYHGFQEAEARLLAKDVIDDPSKLGDLVERRIGTIIIRLTYGHYVCTDDDPFLTLGKNAMDIFSRAAEPGVWLVDSMPMLKYLPTWFPGAGFLATAKWWREIVHKAAWDPYVWSKRSFESGSALLPNTCATAFEALDGKPSTDVDENLVWAACTMMAGGMNTVRSLPNIQTDSNAR